MKKALILAFFLFIWAAPAGATVMGIYPGDLIKLKNDNDPATTQDEVVYYYDKELQRRPFPNRAVYMSWYRDFSGVKEISKEEMAEIKLAGNVVYRPGTRLVKIPSVPKVYAVEPNGVLRWIETEAVAKALYGDDWAKRVDDVSESFFVNYREGAPLTAPLWPTGTVVRRASDTALFLIDGMTKRYVPPHAAASLRFKDADIIPASDLSLFADAANVQTGEWKVVDSAQLSYIDTLSPPQVDFPVNVRTLAAGANEAPLATLRVASGLPVIVKRIRARIEGPLWNGGSPAFSDLAFVDAYGVNLFGVKQLESAPGATSEVVEFTGAYTMEENDISVVDLRAKSSAGLPKGAKFTVSLEREGFAIADGTGGDRPITDYYPRSAFPTFTLTTH